MVKCKISNIRIPVSANPNVKGAVCNQYRIDGKDIEYFDFAITEKANQKALMEKLMSYYSEAKRFQIRMPSQKRKAKILTIIYEDDDENVDDVKI